MAKQGGNGGLTPPPPRTTAIPVKQKKVKKAKDAKPKDED